MPHNNIWNIHPPTEYLPLGPIETSSFKTPAVDLIQQEPLPLNSLPVAAIRLVLMFQARKLLPPYLHEAQLLGLLDKEHLFH